ncbi:outer membrane protein assembly factor BamE domain-containing protein [Ralstonia pseudosolanacearum]|uniref:outer membrane protein assembly factor BamE domain-containing protein n=1 Tax=Ralstonia pseudosolanacearum TaxID=1310165 RepID=UPI003CE88983
MGLLASLLGLFGCDQQKVDQAVDRAGEAAKRAWQSAKPDNLLFKGIQAGQSTEADVRATAGQPDMIWENEDGTRQLEYSRGPEGTSTWLVTIGPDGRVRGIDQLLSADNFGRVRPGQTRDDVRRLLGKPTKVEAFRLKQEEVWGYRWMENPTERAFFNVHFGPDGRVTTTSRSDNRLNGG